MTALNPGHPHHAASRRVRKRLALLPATASALALAMAVPAMAQEATWQFNPLSDQYNGIFNWDTGDVPDTAGHSAVFGQSNTTIINVSTPVVVDAWVFNGDADDYTFLINQQVLFVGDGLVINGGAQSIAINGAGSMLFDGGSAGDASILNNNELSFGSGATAGNATIINNATMGFEDGSAGSAAITNNADLEFIAGSSAENATIANSGTVRFAGGYTTAGEALITTSAGGLVVFSNFTDGGDAEIHTALGGELVFDDNSSAGNAAIYMSGALHFGGAATAGAASIENNGATTFHVTSDAGTATILNDGTLRFVDQSDAADAVITNLAGSGNTFEQLATAGQAAITNGGILAFLDNSTGGDATITNTGLVQLIDSATLGNARLINNAGGTFDIGGLIPGTVATAGSIEGAGQINLGLDHALIVGLNDLSTTYSGVITGGATSVLVKDGAGALTLTGANLYAGQTVVLGGELIVTSTSLPADVINNATLIFDQGFDGTFAGAISGTGVLIKEGDGALTLTGASSHLGGTTVSAGTLIGDTTSLQGDIANNATLIFDLAGAGDFTDVISGSGVLIKDGVGVLTLSGANTYTGGTTILAGAVRGDTTSLQGDIVNAASLIFAQAADGTFAGAISGAGTLIKEGAGALTLTGENAYSGGTLILTGELIGDTTSLQGGITNSATLTFDQGFDGAYDGVISGAGDLNKIGAGALTLTGMHNYTGVTFVDAGSLIVDGSIASSAGLIISAGARLGGTGSVGSTQIEGVVAPGNSIGTLNVVGDIVFAAGSVYEVEVNAAGQSDLIAATGMGVLNGGAVEVVLFPDFALNTPYTILTAAGGVVGAFDSAEWAGGSLFLSPTLAYGANEVVMTIAQTADFDTAAATPNQAAAAGGAQSVGAGALFNAIAVLGDQQDAQDAFDAISGEIHASAGTALIEDSRYLREAATGRLRAAGGDERGAWVHGFGVRGDADSDGNAAALDRSGEGLFFGADGAAANGWRGGALAGYSRSSFDVDDRASSGSASSLHLGAYGGVRSGKLAVRLGAGFSWHDIEVSRTVAFPGLSDSLESDYSAETGQLFAELGYGLDAGAAQLEPFASLAWVSHQTDGFTETGGAAALSGESDGDVTFATVGLRASTRLSDHAAGGARLSGMAGWRHAFGDNPVTVTNTFAAGGDAFTVAGVPLAEDALVLEGGVDMDIAPGATFRLGYAGQLASEASDHSLIARLGVRF